MAAGPVLVLLSDPEHSARLQRRHGAIQGPGNRTDVLLAKNKEDRGRHDVVLSLQKQKSKILTQKQKIPLNWTESNHFLAPSICRKTERTRWGGATVETC